VRKDIRKTPDINPKLPVVNFTYHGDNSKLAGGSHLHRNVIGSVKTWKDAGSLHTFSGSANLPGTGTKTPTMKNILHLLANIALLPVSGWAFPRNRDDSEDWEGLEKHLSISEPTQSVEKFIPLVKINSANQPQTTKP
jgi:hypothetical protein